VSIGPVSSGECTARRRRRVEREGVTARAAARDPLGARVVPEATCTELRSLAGRPGSTVGLLGESCLQGVGSTGRRPSGPDHEPGVPGQPTPALVPPRSLHRRIHSRTFRVVVERRDRRDRVRLDLVPAPSTRSAACRFPQYVVGSDAASCASTTRLRQGVREPPVRR